MAVFSPAEIQRYGGVKRASSYTYISRMKEEGLIQTIEKGKFSITDDPFLVASQVVKPAYISFLSGLSLLGAIDQVVDRIQVATPVRKGKIIFHDTVIEFVQLPPNMMFGYRKVRKENSYIVVGDLEKVIIDFLYKPGKFWLQYAADAVRTGINMERMELYLEKVSKEVIRRRAGFLLDVCGLETRIAPKTDTLFRLNPRINSTGELNKKWGLYVNEVIE